MVVTLSEMVEAGGVFWIASIAVATATAGGTVGSVELVERITGVVGTTWTSVIEGPSVEVILPSQPVIEPAESAPEITMVGHGNLSIISGALELFVKSPPAGLVLSPVRVTGEITTGGNTGVSKVGLAPVRLLDPRESARLSNHCKAGPERESRFINMEILVRKLSLHRKGKEYQPGLWQSYVI
ncbi:hypothetical protein L208DRAFT_1379121 [Tricholoma matsutake]|nr:hypothetical protein L208DRAFT_1379121 [Tricholoma matsutake 945]